MVFRFRSRIVIFLHDLVMVAVAWSGAYWLRFNMTIPPEPEWHTSLLLLPLVVTVQAIIFWFTGLYRGIWRFASVPDLLRITKASFIGIAIIAVSIFVYNRLYGVPRSVILLYPLLLIIILATPRLLYRIWKDQGTRTLGTAKRSLIVGAGKAGEMLARDLLRDGKGLYTPVCFADDDPRKHGSEIHGVRVRDKIQNIPQLVNQWAIEVILLAVPSATDREMQRLVEICESTSLPFLTLPAIQEVSSEGTSGKLREVAIEDLLGRAPINLNRTLVKTHISQKCILVTGGGGSIGSELCKQIALYDVGQLIIVERCEYNLYKIEQELQRMFPDLLLTGILGDVTDQASIEKILQSCKPAVIFHAAAYKHVPLLETQARQAVLNNVLGTRIVAEAAIRAGVDAFVLISTDKAVRPGNVMGATKRAAELLVQSLSGMSATRFITVRFGNVLDSAGSVVPLFREQIRNGGPVTVTHPEVTRYFMTIPEACQLIMQATAVGNGGEIFVLDMGEPVKISYLAEQMIRLSGKQPQKDIRIEYVGLRPGEKLTEELFLEDERPIATEHPKLHLANSMVLNHQSIVEMIDDLRLVCGQFDEEEIRNKLQLLVPEFANIQSDIQHKNQSGRALEENLP